MDIDDRLNKPLDEIIAANSSNRRHRDSRGKGGPVRGSAASRGRRLASHAPYDEISRPKRNSEPAASIGSTGATIKFLISNEVAGLIIGVSGSNIRKFGEVTSVQPAISSSSQTFPGTEFRVLQLTAPSAGKVGNAASIIWEVIALECTRDDVSRDNVKWEPRSGPTHEFDSVEIVGRLTIPSAAAGAVLGRGGAALRELAEAAKVTANLNSKDEEDLSQERVVTVTGTTRGCAEFTKSLISVLKTNNEVGGYIYHIGHYGGKPNPNTANRRVREKEPEEAVPVVRHITAAPRTKAFTTTAVASNIGANLLGTVTTLYLSVPDEAVGAIMGKEGNKLRQVMSVSGASVTVSKRGEFIEGTKNRLITIAGSPVEAQTAYAFLNDLIRESS